MNFVQMCHVENKIDEIIVASPSYEVSLELGVSISLPSVFAHGVVN